MKKVQINGITFLEVGDFLVCNVKKMSLKKWKALDSHTKNFVRLIRKGFFVKVGNLVFFEDQAYGNLCVWDLEKGKLESVLSDALVYKDFVFLSEYYQGKLILAKVVKTL